MNEIERAIKVVINYDRRLIWRSWRNSRGCNMEYGFAKAKGMPIKFITG